MRKNTTEPTEPQTSKPAEAPKASKPKVSGRNWRPLMLMGVILFLAAFVRVAFSFSVSAGSDFALSGGTDASNNLRFIESLVGDHKIRFTDNWENYPEGSLVVVPVLFDAVMSIFAFIFNAIMDDPIKASSLALALSGPVFGVAACIPMYFVGKEMFSSKIAGYASAAFLALCPVFVQESVFSNGTGMSFAVFLFLFGVYFLIKALKQLQGDAVPAYKTSIIAGIFVAAAMGSWIDFRQVAIPLVIVMVAQTIIDRFKNRDPRPATTVYSMVLAIGFVLPCVGYTIVGYFDVLVSGTLIFTVLAIGFATAYSWTYRKPWLLTFPICAGACLLIMLVLAIAAPGLYGDIVSGNSYYNAGLLDIMGRQYLTLSQLTSFYGVITYWFVFLVCLYMLFRFLKNSSSVLYVFTLVWLFVMTLTLGHDAMQAAFCAPVFALGFGVVVKVLLEHVDFKAYFSGIKTGAGSKTKIKRLFSPVPLLSILVAVLLVAGPNMMQVIDAGISSNDASDYNDQIKDVTGNDQFGTLSYYVKTDDSWTARNALKAVEGGYGVVASWMSYSDDVKIYANMKSYTDMYGNGTAAASNILLANGVNGSSAAAVLLTAIIHKGMTDDTKSKLTGAGFSAADVEFIGKVLDSTDYKPEGSEKTVRELVLTDYDTYGSVSSDISDENVKYLYLTDYIASNYHSSDINSAYDAFNMRSPYIMVSGDMMPFFVGYASVFDQMALLNGYDVDTSYGSVPKFTTFGYMAYYYGVYDFTDAMYDTLLYRTYIGMSPSEAGYSGMYAYLSALSSADASVQMHPGYGLSNYEIAYWHVMYNASNNATSDSDGWEEMDATEAIALQKTNGGRINYVSGLPIILKYVPNASGSTVEGTVDDGANPLENIRVVAVDKDGVVHATTHTDADGKFKLFVSDKANTTLVYYAGAGTSSTGGVIVGTNPATSPNLSGVDAEASVDIKVAGESILDGTTLKYDLKIENSAADISESYKEGDNVDGGKFNLGVGSYKITVSKNDTEVASATFNVTGTTTVLSVPVDVYDYTLTVTDAYSVPVTGEHVRLEGAVNIMVDTDDKGVAKFTGVPKGTYDIIIDGYYLADSEVSITYTTSKTIKVADAVNMTVTAPAAGVTVFVYGDAFSTSKVFTAAAEDHIVLPKSDASDTKYTVYCLYDGKIYCGLADTSTATVDLTAGMKDLAIVSGTLKDSDDNAVSGTVYFVTADKMKFKYSVDSEKGYKAYVPAGEALTVYATDSTDAFFGSETYTAGANTEKNITMADANKISTSSLYWSSVYYSYVMATATVGTYELPLMSSSGSFSFYLPKGTAATVAADLKAGTFTATNHDVPADQDSADTFSMTLTLVTTPTMSVTNDMGIAGDTSLNIGGTSHTVTEWATETFTVGTNSKSVTLGASTDDVYFSGTHRFNPLTAGANINLSVLLNGSAVADLSYYSVTVDDYTSDYTVKVYYGDGTSDYATVTGTTATHVCKQADAGAEFRIEIVNNESTKFFTKTYAPATQTYHVADCVDAAIVKGYVGADVDTDMTFTNSGDKTIVSVTDGTYSTVLKKGVAYDIVINDDVSGTRYTFNGPATFTEASQTYNIITVYSPVSYDVDASAAVVDGKVTKLQFTIPADSVTNTSENAENFSFNVGSGWQSYTTVIAGEEVSGFLVDAGAGNPAITFTGYFNASLYHYGSEALLVKVAGSTDSAVSHYVNYDGDAGLVLVNKSSDNIGDSTYEYVYSIVNTGSKDVVVGIDLSGFTVPDGWTSYFKVTTDSGTSAMPVQANITAIPGTTGFSYVLMPVGSATDVPSGTIAFTAAGIGTATPDDITVTEGKASSNAQAAASEVSVSDISAEGRDVVNDKGSVPTIVWVMLAGMALLVILIFWMSSKRGVFARKK